MKTDTINPQYDLIKNITQENQWLTEYNNNFKELKDFLALLQLIVGHCNVYRDELNNGDIIDNLFNHVFRNIQIVENILMQYGMEQHIINFIMKLISYTNAKSVQQHLSSKRPDDSPLETNHNNNSKTNKVAKNLVTNNYDQRSNDKTNRQYSQLDMDSETITIGDHFFRCCNTSMLVMLHRVNKVVKKLDNEITAKLAKRAHIIRDSNKAFFNNYEVNSLSVLEFDPQESLWVFECIYSKLCANTPISLFQYCPARYQNLDYNIASSKAKMESLVNLVYEAIQNLANEDFVEFFNTTTKTLKLLSNNKITISKTPPYLEAEANSKYRSNPEVQSNSNIKYKKLPYYDTFLIHKNRCERFLKQQNNGTIEASNEARFQDFNIN